MFNTTTRIILVALGLCFTWIAIELELVILVLIMLSAVLLQVWGYFRYGTVYLAFKQLKLKQFKRAERTLKETKYPDLLNKNQKSYYHFVLGMIAYYNEDFDLSFDELMLSNALGLRTKNDTAIVMLHLATIELKRGNFEVSKEHITSLKQLKYKPDLEPEIEKLISELSIKSSGNAH